MVLQFEAQAEALSFGHLVEGISRSSMMMVLPRTDVPPGAKSIHATQRPIMEDSTGQSSGSWTRKRAASIGPQDEEKIQMDRFQAQAEVPLSGGDGRDHVCLCQSDPKIPRPRNGKLLSHGIQ